MLISFTRKVPIHAASLAADIIEKSQKPNHCLFRRQLKPSMLGSEEQTGMGV